MRGDEMGRECGMKALFEERKLICVNTKLSCLFSRRVYVAATLRVSSRGVVFLFTTAGTPALKPLRSSYPIGSRVSFLQQAPRLRVLWAVPHPQTSLWFGA
jgi:hypothetical protein